MIYSLSSVGPIKTPCHLDGNLRTKNVNDFDDLFMGENDIVYWWRDYDWALNYTAFS